jgi:PAS domain S-box-containing protein
MVMRRSTRETKSKKRPISRPGGRITKKGRRSAQLYRQPPELQLIYDTAPVGLAFLTPDCRYAQINQRLTEICGISVADHIGRSVRQTVPQVADQVEKIVQAVTRTGEPVIGIEVHGQRVDKLNADHVWITSWHPLRKPDGSIVGVNVVAEDVTERKRAEATLAAAQKALRELNENLEHRVRTETRERLQIWNVSRDLLVVADMAGTYLNVNPAWKATLGWSETELLGKTSQWLLHPEDLETTRAQIDNLAAGRTSPRFESRYRHKDGSYRWIAWKAVSNQERIYAVGRDITDLKEAESELRQTRRELARVARHTAFAAMTAAIAHEIKQPLGAIVTNANAGQRWLDRSPPALDEVRDTLKHVAADGLRATEVIQSVRAMFAKGEPTENLFDVNELIRETIGILGSELDAEKIELTLALAPQIPLLPGHRAQLQQVMLNIVTNAVDAMRDISDRARVLTIRTAPSNSAGIAISIEDSGTGISSENVDRMFDAFFTTKSNSMGMGLAICRSIVEAHAGRMFVSPNRPHGSVFHIVLPGDH